MNAPTARGRHDVQKSWRDPGALRAAEIFVGVVLALAFAALGVVIAVTRGGIDECGQALCTTADRYLLASPAGVLMLGVVGAFIKTIRVWRRGGSWPIWQGAGWVLMVFALAYMVMATGIVARG